jgi:hypothetical protein
LNTSRWKYVTAQDRLAAAAERLDREADQQRDEQRLQHVALGERGDQRGRDDPEQEVDRAGLALGLGGTGAAQLVGELQPGTRVQPVAHDQPDRQRERRHHHEVSEGEAADTAM